MLEIGKFAFDLIIELLASAIAAGVSYEALPYFRRRKIERRVEDATAEVVEPLLPFLSQEGVSEDKQRRLIQTCVEELRPLANEPSRLFEGSLNGQKIFEELYSARDLPRTIIEDGLKDVYALLFPRVATLLCRIPAAVKDWETEAWSENFRRFDDIATQLRSLFVRVDEIANQPSLHADETLTIVRRSLAQKIGLELDLTGLRADSPIAGKFDDFFIHPSIKRIEESSRLTESEVVATATDSINHFLQQHSRSVVIGPPGSGKSTWSKWLQRQALTRHWNGLPIRIELRQLSGETLPPLQHLVRDTVSKHFAEELTSERIGRWLEERQLIFILDGFDEIKPSDRDEMIEWVMDLKTAARGCGLVLTSRPLTTDHLERLRRWNSWSIEPFDELRIVEYILRWYQKTPLIPDSEREVNAEALAEEWSEDPTIGPLTGNPLLLSTLLMVHHLDGSLPGGRSQLYQRYVQGMLGLWDDRRKVTATTALLSLEQKRQILRGLALHLFLTEEDQLDEGDALTWLQGSLEELKVKLPAQDVLAMLRERSGLIVGPGIYSFAHKSIAEYLVAETILQGDRRDKEGKRLDRFRLFEYREDDRWNTVTFLWAGLAPISDLESFIDETIDAQAFQLGIGILSDQWERISGETKRRLTLKICKAGSKFPQFHETTAEFVGSHAAKQIFLLPIPTFYLRGLTPNASFYQFIFKAVHDNTLIWDDINRTEGTLRDLLWMGFVRGFTDIGEWKTRLDSGLPRQGEPEDWAFWLLETAAVSAHETDLETVLSVFKEACPTGHSDIPLALICASLWLMLGFTSKEGFSRSKRLLEILEALPNSNNGEIPAKLLLTKDWVLGRGRTYNDHVGDLLSFFFTTIEDLVQKGEMKRSTVIDQAIEFVNDLRRQRDSLIVGATAQ